MSYYTKVRTYLNSPVKCFIPKCNARCCVDAPLPEGFLEQHKGRIQRRIYGAVNIGQNDPRDTFNSIIYNTTPSPVQLMGFDQNGNKMLGIPKEVIKELNIKSMEQIQELLNDYGRYKNYCPFITTYGKCSVYNHRPIICREFGSSPLKIDYCPQKSSKLDIIKFCVKEFFNFKKNFKAMGHALKMKFAKNNTDT